MAEENWVDLCYVDSSWNGEYNLWNQRLVLQILVLDNNKYNLRVKCIRLDYSTQESYPGGANKPTIAEEGVVPFTLWVGPDEYIPKTNSEDNYKPPYTTTPYYYATYRYTNYTFKNNKIIYTISNLTADSDTIKFGLAFWPDTGYGNTYFRYKNYTFTFDVGGKVSIKTGDNTWSKGQVYIKTDDSTWSKAKAVWIKTGDNTWSKAK